MLQAIENCVIVRWKPTTSSFVGHSWGEGGKSSLKRIKEKLICQGRGSRVTEDFESTYMTQLLLLGKFKYGGGPIFKVVLEC